MIFLAALRKEIFGQWRSYRLLVVVAVFLAFGLLSPLAAKFIPELMKLMPNGKEIARLIPQPTITDAVAQYLKNSSQFGVVLALLMTMGAVAQEKDKGTAALVLVKPMPRSVFLWAKFAALGVTFIIGIAIAGAACYYYTLILFRAPDVSRWLALNGLLFLFVLVYVALTLLCSTVSRSQVVAGGLAFGLVILLSGTGAIPGIGKFLPGQLLAWGAWLAAGSKETAWPALWISVGIIGAALAGAWAVFERQEL
ncbi:MAG: ABC transporter permease subunit [Spirochaetes bacterium]|nr:ABC transporter permease subunit [Spirochaetota bacterium]